MTELETAPAQASSAEFRVELDLFEGPLDLLLFLIRKNELEITALALAQITSQYLAFLEVFRGLNISVAGEYLVHAATLVELKSSTLLLGKKLEDDLELEAATQELLAQLRERSGLRGLAEALEQSNQLMMESMGRADFTEGVASFVEGRPPRFEGVSVKRSWSSQE